MKKELINTTIHLMRSHLISLQKQIDVFKRNLEAFAILKTPQYDSYIDNLELEMKLVREYIEELHEELKLVERPVRLNFECVSQKYLYANSESFAYSESFIEGMKDAIESYPKSVEEYNLMVDQYSKSVDEETINPYSHGDWFHTIYYTNEDNGYYFYLAGDIIKEEN